MAGKLRGLYYFLNRYVFSILPDCIYHNLLCFIITKRAKSKFHWLKLSNPRTFNEKLQWLKNHGNIELKRSLADKYDVRKYVLEIIGEKYLIKLLDITKSGNKKCTTDAKCINFDTLPNSFVLKLTKGSGYNIVVTDKSKLNIIETIHKLDKWLKVDNSYLSREPQYRGQNKIICEEFLKFNIEDYKFFCFDGEPKFLKVDFNRFTEHQANYYDMNWQLLDINECACPRNPNKIIKRPIQFNEMIEVAQKLSKGFPFVRIDLYIHNDKVYFGEMTFIPGGGYTPLEPRDCEFQIGNMINLNNQYE